MKVIVFGASGMIGQAVLRACFQDGDVTEVLAVGRRPLGVSHPKLRELVHRDFMDFTVVAAQLQGFDACLFCLGVSSAGMSEEEYTKVTYGFTMAAATLLSRQNPPMVFVYVTGSGTDSSESGRGMWGRVKGRTENALLKLPFKGAYMFRPGYIQPVHGEVSQTKLYRYTYAVLSPFYPLLKRLAPQMVTDSERLAKAMLKVAKVGTAKSILETQDINALGA